MGKPSLNKGYTLIESLFVLMILTILFSFSIPLINKNKYADYKIIINRIVNKQFAAIMECQEQEYDEDGIAIHFNRKGNVKQANTYYYDDLELIVSLATGRVYVKTEG